MWIVAALRLDLGRGRLPHHAGAAARILEGLDQRLDDLVAVLRAGLHLDRAAQRVRHGAPQVEALDALRGPVGGDLLARHAPHLLGVGLEEDREQPVAELVRHPLAKVLRVGVGKRLLVGVRQHAHRALDDAEVAQRLERLQRIGVELAVVVDAAQARALDEVVGQDLVPEVDDLLRLGEEAVAADVEKKALIVNGAADAADIGRVGLDHGGGDLGLRQQIGRRQARRPGADDEDIRMLHAEPRCRCAIATRPHRGRAPRPSSGRQAKGATLKKPLRQRPSGRRLTSQMRARLHAPQARSVNVRRDSARRAAPMAMTAASDRPHVSMRARLRPRAAACLVRARRRALCRARLLVRPDAALDLARRHRRRHAPDRGARADGRRARGST